MDITNCITNNYNIKHINSFHISCVAKHFAKFSITTQLLALLHQYKHEKQKLVLGGGSNILFTKNYDGLILKNEILGIQILHESDSHICIKVAAGENWHSFVQYCITNNYGGIENLSLIPGNVGASPIQNIGAYGVEVKDVIDKVEGYFIDSLQPFQFLNSACNFGYRDSIFKRELKHNFVITYVTFKLNKQPTFNISYGAIQQELDKLKVDGLSIKAISQAVINIRSSKLPNIQEIGNAGSFFKNPEVGSEVYNTLKAKYKNLVAFALPNSNYKLAAGWLIEYCGFKGYRIGDAGCYPKQALVLVNYGNATGTEIYNLSEAIINKVNDEFGVLLQREVNVV